MQAHKNISKNFGYKNILTFSAVIISIILFSWTKHAYSRQVPQSDLLIAEWGVRLPVASEIKDVYYTMEGSNTSSDGTPNTAWLGLTSLNSGGCNVSFAGPSIASSPIGSIIRVSPLERDPISGNLYTEQYKDGLIIDNYYYVYLPWKNKKCASSTVLASKDAAFAKAAKNIQKK